MIRLLKQKYENLRFNPNPKMLESAKNVYNNYCYVPALLLSIAIITGFGFTPYRRGNITMIKWPEKFLIYFS